MSEIAQELDEKVMDLVRDGLREQIKNEIDLASLAIDVIRNINESGFVIIEKSEIDLLKMSMWANK